jgi:hypothetical protein
MNPVLTSVNLIYFFDMSTQEEKGGFELVASAL